MANTLLTPTVIANQALATLYESCVMAQLVHRDYEPEFARRVGDTITIRKPAVFTANEYTRAAGITVQDATESGIPVTLNHFADVSFAVTSEDMALKVDDFDGQFLTPAMEAMAQKIDRDVVALRSDITQTSGGVTVNAAGEDYAGYEGAYPWSDSRVLVEAGAKLNALSVPMQNRRVVMGPMTAGRWSAEKTWRHADRRGGTEGLREASLGDRVSGFDPYMSQNIGQPKAVGSQVSGDPTTEQSIAFHESAFALAIRPLELPRGAANAAIANYKGFGLRVVYAYDTNKKQDVVSIDCLYGTKTIAANRAVLIKGANKP